MVSGKYEVRSEGKKGEENPLFLLLTKHFSLFTSNVLLPTPYFSLTLYVLLKVRSRKLEVRNRKREVTFGLS